MKKYTSIFLGAASFAFATLSVQAAPLFSVGDNLDVFFDGSLKGQFNSNVTNANSNKIADYALIMSPGVVANYGRNNKVSANIYFREDMIRYLDNAIFNTNLAKLFIDAAYKGDPLTVKVNFSYNQMYQNTPSALGNGNIPGIIRNDVLVAGANGTYVVSPKTSLDLGFTYRDNQYVEGWEAAYNNCESFIIPAAFYYSYSPQLDLGVFFTYTRDNLSNVTNPANLNPVTGAGYGRDRDNYFGGVSARIKSWERLSGLVNVGVTSVDVDGVPNTLVQANNYFNFGMDIGLSYELTQKINLFVKGYQNYSVGAQGQNIENTGGIFNARYQINEFFDLTGNFIQFTHSVYTDSSRVDDTYSSGFSFGYTPNSYLRFAVGYTYFMNSSNWTGCTYNNNIAYISGTLRY